MIPLGECLQYVCVRRNAMFLVFADYFRCVPKCMYFVHLYIYTGAFK